MPNPLRFTKMHGAGNDYLYVDATQDAPALSADAIRRLSDRRKGVGADGVVLIESSEVADLHMRMFNADGSEGAMCGNAIRCVAKYALERGLTTSNPVGIETATGVREVFCTLGSAGQVESIRVDMGVPHFKPADLPSLIQGEYIIDLPLADLLPEFDAGRGLRMTCLSMGNPHAVFLVDPLTDALVLGLGPLVETSPIFPDRINVEFVRIDNRDELTMRVWERGSGETHACGTGACAAVVAAVLTDRCDRDVLVHLPGGDLQIAWPDSSGPVLMTGPAEFVFDGECKVE